MKYFAILLIFLSLNAKADITTLIGTGQKSDHSLQSLNQSGSISVYSLEVLYRTQNSYLLGAEYLNYKDTKLFKVGLSLGDNFSIITGVGIRSEERIVASNTKVVTGAPGAIPQLVTEIKTERQYVPVLWPIEVIYKVDKINLGAEILTGDTYLLKVGWTF